MIDKVQKIREEVERLKEETSIGLSEYENGVEHGRMEIINALSLFLDSLQEKPVSKVWHDASKKYPLAVKEIIVLRDNKIYYGKYIGGFHRYVRAEIQLTDDMAQTYAIIDYLTEKDKWMYVEDLLKLSNVQRIVKDRKEPVSEDLEEALAREWKGYNDRGAVTVDALEDNTQELAFAKGFYRGAKWKEEQMKEVLQTEYEKGRHDALEK